MILCEDSELIRVCVVMFSLVKIVLIVSFVLMNAFEGWLRYLDNSQVKKELPDNVKDVYDEEEYKKWLSYNKECGKSSLICSIVTNVFLLIFLAFDFYAFLFEKFAGLNLYLQYFICIGILVLITLPVSISFAYYDTFVIEEKYGMNKSTRKTFAGDQIKGFFLDLVLGYGLIVVIMTLYEKFGNDGIIFAIIAYILLSVILGLVVMPLLRMFNKFEQLEDGELREALLKLCEKYGVKVKKIYVKDASRRTTKANAFCTGFGKKKVISLDDNLVNEYSTEQIVAVFAHEFAHAKYKHMVKSLPFSFLRIVIVMITLGVVLNVNAFFTSFGFGSVNYYFAFSILSLVNWPLEKLLDIVGNYISRKHEYQADAFAAKEGYGDELISSLKKLCRDSLTDLNPHPVIVKLEYSHPTLSQRIEAIERE